MTAQAALFTSSTRAVYSLSPCPLPSLSLLTAYALSSIPDSASSKWKSAEGGYGTIVHPEGPRKKVVDKKGKGKAVEPLRKASAPAALGKPKPKEKEKLKEKPKDRPMGERRGLFAKPAEPVVVPKKRKASPPPAKEKVVDKVVEKPKKKVSNGIFDDEVSEDEEDDEEQAMREMEAEAAKAEKKKVAAAAKAKASANMSGKTATKASGSGSASGSGAAAKGMTAAEKKAMAEKETKELEVRFAFVEAKTTLTLCAGDDDGRQLAGRHGRRRRRDPDHRTCVLACPSPRDSLTPFLSQPRSPSPPLRSLQSKLLPNPPPSLPRKLRQRS